MTVRHRAVVATCLAVVIAGLVAGCGSSGSGGGNASTSGDTENAEGLVVGFSNGVCDNAWRAQALAGIELAAEKYEKTGAVKELKVACAQGDVSRQISDVKSMIASGVDVLLVIPLSNALASTVSQATSRGIVTVPFNLPLEGAEYTSFVGVDPCRKAKMNAEWLSSKVKGKPGGVVGLGGTPGNAYTELGWKCASEVFDEEGVKTLTLRPANWETAKAKQVMTQLIAGYPDISGVWTDGGNNAVGAAEALIDAGKPLIPMTGDDYNGFLTSFTKWRKEFPEYEISAVPEPPDGESTKAFELGIEAAEGKSVEQNHLIPVKIYTGSELEELAQPDLPADMYAVTDLPEETLQEIFK